MEPKFELGRKLQPVLNLLDRSIYVFVLLMAISITAHMIYFHLRKGTLHVPVSGPYHEAASNLFASKGSAIWTHDSANDKSLAYNPPVYTFFLAASYLIFGENWGVLHCHCLSYVDLSVF
jgi:hypothetical protein